MDEATAKTKWCPFARVGHEIRAEDAPFNRLYDDSEDPDATLPTTTRCIGSACMSWRWLPAERTEALSAAVKAHIERNPILRGMDAEAATIVIGNARLAREQGRSTLDFARVEGFCGLAGPVSG